MKLVTLLFAAAALFGAAGIAHAQFDERWPAPNDGNLVYAAQDVQQEADVLTQVLRRENADYRLVYNSGLVLDAAIRLVEALESSSADAFYTAQEVLDAHRTLHDQWTYARVQPSYYAQEQLRQLDRAVWELDRALPFAGGIGTDDGRNPGHGGGNPGQGGGVVIIDPRP